MKNKRYYLKYKDEICLEFSYDALSKDIKINSTMKCYAFIPKNLQDFNCEDLKDFLLLHNFIPKSRHNYSKLFKNIGDEFYLYEKFHGLNVNNNLWICRVGSQLKWDDINCFDHFKNELFLQMLSENPTIKKPEDLYSPDWFTNGEAIKSWNQINNEIYLLKAPIAFYDKYLYSNFAEYFSSQVAQLLFKNSVRYDLVEHDNKLLTKCRNFCSKLTNYFPFSQLFFNRENLEEKLIELYGQENYEDLMVFDALIFNTDRNLGNFGLLYDTKSDSFVKPAPIFDFNKSLAYDFPIYQNKIGMQQLENYSKRLTAFYESFDVQLYKFARPRHIEWVKKLEKFKFKNTSCVKDKKYIKFIKEIIKNQTEKLSEILERNNSINV
ncbi:HipA family kinase [Mycoplasma phocoeninasale]|uniref:HipA family kinase n=1 Tax=Mycoplasma phocoeninasale TaxID=2726117 RepID=UPI001967FD69|nr:HipA family kinase [Mycoplasma phocoeninasale]MBN0970694.1 hypothetical protein [Mycoplasma phocoeninasale]